MRYFELSSGQKMPSFGLGTWQSNEGLVYQAVLEAIKLGYKHIDCAPIYGNEPEVGKALKEALNANLITREDLWVTSKLWNNHHAAEDVEPALKQTLSDLKLEYLDLFLIHWPVACIRDVIHAQRGEDFLSLEKAPLSETWQAMEECVEKGLVRAIGVSNFSVKKLGQLQQAARISPAVNQVELHPFLQQNTLLEYCKKNDIRLTAYAPLGSPGRPEEMKGQGETSLLDHPEIVSIAQKHGVPAGQVLIQWAITRGTVAIPKSVNPQRIKENIGALDLTLDQEDMIAISNMDRHHRYVDGSFFEAPGSPYTLENIWDEQAGG